jgi:hypothetical protein
MNKRFNSHNPDDFPPCGVRAAYVENADGESEAASTMSSGIRRPMIEHVSPDPPVILRQTE